MTGLVRDVRYGLRVLKRERSFAIVSVGTMALGIGATTLLFSIANGVLLKPLPWPDGERVVRVTESRNGQPARIKGTISNGAYLAWREQPSTIAALGGYSQAPNVAHAAVGNALPFVAIGRNFGFSMPSPSDPGVKLQAQILLRLVDPEYFPALRLRLVEGRLLSDSDTITARPVVVVNRSFAQRYLGTSAVGRRVPIPFGEGRPDCDVVGVVDDMRQGDVTDPAAPEAFAPYRQMPNALLTASLVVVLRTAGDPVTLAPLLRTAIREQEPQAVAESIMTMDERVVTSLAKPRLYAIVLGGFALSAVAIACVGLFGVLSYSVAQRTREIGLRAALGARPVDVMMLVVRQGFVATTAGIVSGLWIAFAAGRLLARFLYGVGTHDIVSFAGAFAVVVVVSAIACIVPARRAARVDPLVALRSG